MRQATWYERVVALLGAALIGLLWAPWYAVDVAGLTSMLDRLNGESSGGPLTGPTDFSGWSSGTVTSIVVAVVGALCIAQLIALWRERSPAVGLAWNVSITLAAILLVVWLLVRVIWPPDEFLLRDWGVWTSLIVALGILVTNWLGMGDERTAKAPARDVPIRQIPPPAAKA